MPRLRRVGASERRLRGELAQAEIIARVHAHCGEPPQIEAIQQAAKRGLVRVAFNALDLRLAEKVDDVDALIAKARLLLAVECPKPALELLRIVFEFGVPEHEIALDLSTVLVRRLWQRWCCSRSRRGG